MMAEGAIMAAARGPAGSSGPGPGPAGPGPGLPGVLHFIQQEWGRFEAERRRWEAERAELQAQVTLLQGECQGGQRSRSELLRRLRMLEAALTLERAKCHQLQHDRDAPAPEDAEAAAEAGVEAAPERPAEWGAAVRPEGRHLLRQYLRDGGVSERRSRRLRSVPAHGAEEPGSPPAGASRLVRHIEEQIRRNATREPPEHAGATSGPGDGDSDEDEDTEDAATGSARPAKKQRGRPSEDKDNEVDSEDALVEFLFVGAGSRDDAPGSWNGAAPPPEPRVGMELPRDCARSGAASRSGSASQTTSRSGYPVWIPDLDT